jgi:hypothetical protein
VVGAIDRVEGSRERRLHEKGGRGAQLESCAVSSARRSSAATTSARQAASRGGPLRFIQGVCANAQSVKRRIRFARRAIDDRIVAMGVKIRRRMFASSYPIGRYDSIF